MTRKSDTDWSPDDILAAVRKRGQTISSLERMNEFHRGRPCSTALIQPHEAGEVAISRFLGIPAHEIWPSRYSPTGQRLRPQPPQNYHRMPRFRNREAGRAA